LQQIEAEIKQGKNVYRNAILTANAYYNITYFGNARLFFESDITVSDTYGYLDADSVATAYKSMALAEKYYHLTLRSATIEDEKARCTFMLAKCALNDVYNLPDYNKVKPAMFLNITADNAASKRYYSYFKSLKQQYSETSYYREALKECGYFNDYVKLGNK
jgi:hypothetical protein